MASLTGKSGKCSNFGNCSLADARTPIEVPGGQDFVCTECSKPLLLTDTGSPSGGNAKVLAIGALLLMVLLAGGMGWSLMSGKEAPASSPAPEPTPTMVIEQPQAPAPASTVPITGDCSQADASAGLCRRPTP